MKLKILFFPIALFVAFMITIFFTKPEWDIYKEKQTELKSTLSERDDLQGGFESLQKAENRFKKLSSNETNLIKNAIPGRENNDDFIAEVHKSAEESGVFIVSSKVKESRASKSRDPLAALTPQMKKADALITVMGAYTDIAKFVKKLDSHNRLTLTSELLIIAQDRSVDDEEVEGEEGGQSLDVIIKGEVAFSFFEKERNKKVQIAKLIGVKDPVINGLLRGQLKTGVIDSYRDFVTKEAFLPITAEKGGKQDLFAE